MLAYFNGFFQLHGFRNLPDATHPAETAFYPVRSLHKKTDK